MGRTRVSVSIRSPAVVLGFGYFAVACGGEVAGTVQHGVQDSNGGSSNDAGIRSGTGGRTVVTGGSFGIAGSGGGGAGSGGIQGRGGSGNAGTGGGGAVGASGGAGAMPVDYVCSRMPPRDPGLSGADGASCCSGAGKCAAPSTIPRAMQSSLGHDTCQPTLLCAPTSATGPKICTTHVGFSDPTGQEGRCVPSCFMLGNPRFLMLDDGGTCASGELCAPCFSPVDATSTGACTQNGDAPTRPAPAPYAMCPAGNDAGEPPGGGLCVPLSALAKAGDQTSPLYNPAVLGFKQDSCASGETCIPAKKAADPSYCATHCTTSTTMQGIGVEYTVGACVPAFIIFDIAGQTGITISTGGGPCPTGELCNPCQDPLNPGLPTGACY